MKKIYLTLGLGVLFLGANAQQKSSTVITENPINFSVLANGDIAAKVAATSTLTPPTFTAGGCATNTANIVYYSTAQYTATPSYTIDARGYMFGTNKEFQTQGTTTFTLENTLTAQKYSFTGTANVTDIIVYAGKITSDAATSMVTAAVYSENATTKAPSAQVGVVGTKALNSFVPGANIIHLASPAAISTGNFFATVQSPAIGGATHDTLAIISTKVGCSTTDSLCWRKLVVNGGVFSQWSSVKSDFGVNVDALIFPVIDITTGLSSVSKGNLTLLAAFPNPAANEISINFGLNQSSKVEIEIYDVTGKVINTIKLDNLEIGNHTSKINTSSLSSGVYMYSVKSENARMFSKFTIAK